VSLFLASDKPESEGPPALTLPVEWIRVDAALVTEKDLEIRVATRKSYPGFECRAALTIAIGDGAIDPDQPSVHGSEERRPAVERPCRGGMQARHPRVVDVHRLDHAAGVEPQRPASARLRPRALDASPNHVPRDGAAVETIAEMPRHVVKKQRVFRVTV